MRWDGWKNAITGVNTAGRDKRSFAAFEVDQVSRQGAEALWRGDDLAARMVEVWPDQMLREGWDLRIADDPGREISEKVEARAEELNINGKLWRSLAFERAYGGAGALKVVNDLQGNLRIPLRSDLVSSFKGLIPFEADELDPLEWETDVRSPEFGNPSIYRLQPVVGGGIAPPVIEVHTSRLLIFPGIRVSRRQVIGTLVGWGDSVFNRVVRILRNYNLSWESASALLEDFAQGVFKIKGLAEIFAQDNNELFITRLEAMDLSRSVLRAIVLDAEEDFERKPTPMAGLPDLLDRFKSRIAAAADMPETLLFGSSPGGLNATGASDISFFDDRVRAKQQNKLRPLLEDVIQLIFRDLGIDEPEKWSIEFRPLRQMSDAETATARKTQAETDAMNIQNDVLSPDEVAQSRYGGDGYSFETQIDFEARESQERDELAEARTLLEQMQADKEKMGEQGGENNTSHEHQNTHREPPEGEKDDE